MSAVFELFGRFHPVLVHLPIGFLILALLFQWLSVKEKYAGLAQAVRISFLLGMIFAVLSCLSGLALSSGGEYDEATLQLHKYFGISVAVFSLIGYIYSARPHSAVKMILSIITIVLIIITGHLGGTLTHGENFLTKGIFQNAKDSIRTKKIITDVQQAVVFDEIIQPILIDKCGTCHSATKQKGGLRLDGKDWIVKGGKDGPVFVSGNADASELYKRVMLDPLEEKHMSPKGKPQLTEQEIILLRWWINSNAGFTRRANEVLQTPQVVQALQALQSSQGAVIKKSSIPGKEVEKISEAVLDTLRTAGITVVPVAANTNYLTANFVSIPKLNVRTVALLKQISKQLIWLKINYTELSDDSWKVIGACTALTRLSIDHTNMNDIKLFYLSTLVNLQYFNLVATKVSAAGITQLKKLPALENLFLGQTLVRGNDFAVLQKQFPKIKIDSGNYRVENLATDTQLLKPPGRNN